VSAAERSVACRRRSAVAWHLAEPSGRVHDERRPGQLRERPQHKTPAIRAAIAARPWLRVYLLPAYAPELNPVEKVWSTMKGSLANLAVRTATDLATAVKNRLNRMQYRTGLIDGFFTGTGLSPPTRP